MTRFAFSSLRARLMVLVLLAAVPAFGLMLYTSIEERRRATDEVGAGAIRMAGLVAGTQIRLIEETRRFLVDLSVLPEARTQSARECSRRVALILMYSRPYANVGAVDSEGRWFCSALPLSQPVSVADRPWFQRNLRNRAFTGGNRLRSAVGAGRQRLQRPDRDAGAGHPAGRTVDGGLHPGGRHPRDGGVSPELLEGSRRGARR